MTLALPNLDDRRWLDLVQEGQALIPFYAPAWTDHNAHDPGITLLELLAWLAEQDIYRVNQIPESHIRKFLELVNIVPAPPQPAQAVVSFALKQGVVPITLPRGVECQGQANGQAILFRTLEEITVLPGTLEAIQVNDTRGLRDMTVRFRRGDSILPFGADPQPGATLYLGLSQAPHSEPLSLYFTCDDFLKSAQAWRALEQAALARDTACHAAPALLSCEEANSSAPEATHHHLAHYSVHTVWEYLASPNEWRSLTETQVMDDTRAFTLNGRVQMLLPAPVHKMILGQATAPLYYLRCRFVAGSYDAAPELENVALNGVRAEQAVRASTLNTSIPAFGSKRVEKLGIGSGFANQQVKTSQAPVVESTLQVWTQEQGIWVEWARRTDLYSSRGADSHFVLDATTGVLTFGDGSRGRCVPGGAQIVAHYCTTAAQDGNLAAQTISKLALTAHNRERWPDCDASVPRLRVTNPLPARNGAAAETLAHAQGRARVLLETPTRAVALADFEYFARQTPGAQLARVSARANLHVDFPCYRASGVVTVIILPWLPRTKPMPSAALCALVAAHLNHYRLIGTRVEVVGPEYVTLAVRATIKIRAGANRTVVRERVIAALNQFFDPLAGGPDGSGYPFGRDVVRTEVLQQIDQVDGVEYVRALEFLDAAGDATCGNVCVGPIGLVAAGAHDLTME